MIVNVTAQRVNRVKNVKTVLAVGCVLESWMEENLLDRFSPLSSNPEFEFKAREGDQTGVRQGFAFAYDHPNTHTRDFSASQRAILNETLGWRALNPTPAAAGRSGRTQDTRCCTLR